MRATPIPAAGRRPALAATLALAVPLQATAPAQQLVLGDAQAARDETGAGRAFVEVASQGDVVYVGQAVRVRLRFGVDAELLESGGLVQIFLRELDVPVQVHAPWLAGARALPPTPSTGSSPRSFALGDGIAPAARAADRQDGARRYAVFESSLALGAARTGALELAAPTLRYAWARRFADDLVRGRVPLERTDALVRGAPLTITVLDVPEEGRPPDHTGAVGRFELAAEVWPRDVEYGQSLELQLTIQGEAGDDPATFPPPRWDEVPGFLMRGRLDEVRDGARTLRYDLAPVRADVRAVPELSVSWFDPGPPAGFRTFTTPSVPILVRPARRAPSTPREPVPPGPPAGAGFAAAGPVLVLSGTLALVALVIIVLAVRAYRARSRRERAPPS